MRKLAIYGAGGHGKVVADTACMLGWKEVVFFDEQWPKLQINSSWRVVGKFKNLIADLNSYEGIIVAIGNSNVRVEKSEELKLLKAKLVSLVHPMAFVSSKAIVGIGSVVLAGAMINIDAKVEEACIINTGATVDHDCIIARGVHVCPGANLSGGVHVGEFSWIGVGSCVRQGIKIGSNVMVGAGAVIVKNVPNGAKIIGIAASQLNT